MTYLTDDGLYPSNGGMLGNGFAIDGDPMRAVLLVQPNRNEKAAPIDRSRSGSVTKTLVARNGAKLVSTPKRYGTTALEVKRAAKGYVEITPPGEFAFGPAAFAVAINIYPYTAGFRGVIFSSGTAPGCYQIAYEADKTVSFSIIGGATHKTSIAFDPNRHVHVLVQRTAAGLLTIRLEGKTYLSQAGVTDSLTADAGRVLLGSADGTNDCFDGTFDGLQFAVGETLYGSDFGNGVTGAVPVTGAFYVDPVNGADGNAGTLTLPLRTLAAARDAMRASVVKKTILRGGRYDLRAAALALTSADSGTVWEAYPNETPVLSGAERLTGFFQEPNGQYSVSTTLTDLDVVIGDTRQRPAMNAVFNPADPYKTGWLFCPTDGSTTMIPFAAGAVAAAELEDGVKVQAFDRDRLSDHIGSILSITTGGAAAAPWPVLPSGITTHKWVDPVNGNDGAAGDQGTPWKTLSKAFASATVGTCVHCLDGVYNGNVAQTANGTASNPIVFVSETKHGAKVIQPVGGSTDTGVALRGHYTHFLGFDVDGSSYVSGTRWRIGVYLTGANARAAWNKVHDFQRQAGGNSVSGAAIYGDFWNNNLNQIVEFNTVYNIGPDGTTSSSLHGIYMSGTGAVNGNLVYKCVGAAIHLWHAPRTIKVFNNTMDDGYIGFFGGFDAAETYNGFAGPMSGVEVRNNVASNMQYGYAEYQQTGVNTYDNNLTFNCVTPWRLLNGNTHTNSKSADPLYVNRTGRDYRLAANSPCIGTGVATGTPPAIDLDGYPRPIGTAFELGAFEYTGGQGVITTTSAMQYALRAGSTFRLLNRAAYIRNAQEFGWRAADGKLVIRPGSTTFESDGVYVARVASLLTLTGCTGTTWTGITFAHTLWHGTAVTLSASANDNTFDRCTFKHLGTALRFSASNTNTVKNSAFASLAWGGVYMQSGASGNTVTKTAFTDVGVILKGGMAVGGDGCSNNVVSNNDVLRCARYAVSFKSFNAGNPHSGNRVEYNKIESVLLESADGGAIESLGRANNNTALSVKGNWINGAKGLATSTTGAWLDGYKGFGVYLDDMTNGVTVRDNLIRGTSWASVFVHGGDNNTVTNNIMVCAGEQEAAIRLEHQPAGGTSGLLVNNTVTKNIIHYAAPVNDYWSLLTPGTFTLGQNFVFGSGLYTSNTDVQGDPLFVDLATLKFNLKTGSPAFQAIGFTQLPFAQMGITGLDGGDPATGGGTTNPNPNPDPGTGYPANRGGYLVRGNQIVDGAMKPIRLTGANWSGAEWNDAGNSFGLLPGGATARNYKASMDHFKALGFNCIRLCFADSTVTSTRTTHGFAEGPNSEFRGKRPIDILGMYCKYAQQIGVTVILDHHRNNASTGSGTQVNFLAGDGFTLQNIIDNWKTLVTHPDIFGNPAVLGCDVHNEPNGRNFNWTIWAPQAEQIANAILSVNPNLICFIEGNEISFSQGGEAWGWWGGNLRDYDTRPITLSIPDKLALSAHEYGTTLVGEKPYHRVAGFPANMFGPANWSQQRGIWDFFWGYLWRAKRFPLLIGEFGAFFNPGDTKEIAWVQALHRYMNGELNGDGQMFLSPGDCGISWTMWAMNPTSGDTGGIWNNDWSSVSTQRYNQYKDQLWRGSITPPPQIRVNGTRI